MILNGYLKELSDDFDQHQITVDVTIYDYHYRLLQAQASDEHSTVGAILTDWLEHDFWDSEEIQDRLLDLAMRYHVFE